MIKTPAELALMQAANDVTIAALRHLHGRVEAGMSGAGHHEPADRHDQRARRQA